MELGRCISSFLNYTLQNKLHIEKSFHLPLSGDVVALGQPSPTPSSQQQQQQLNDECYDPNVDPHFAVMLPPSLVAASHHHRQISGGEMSDSIYERLPDEDMSQQPFNPMPSSLVTRGRLPKQIAPPQPPSLHSFATDILPPSMVDTDARFQLMMDPNGVSGDESFFSGTSSRFEQGNNCGDGQEHLVKPSQLKQRRRLNRKLNLCKMLAGLNDELCVIKVKLFGS